LELPANDEVTGAIRDGLQALGIERLVLAIHDQSFPSDADEDLGRGSPYGLGARRLLGFAAGLGFNGLQFGPQGDTSLVNPSPYDGAQFSRAPASMALGALSASDDDDWRALASGLLEPVVAARPGGAPDRVQHAYAWRATRGLLAQIFERFRATEPARPALAARFAAYRGEHGAALGPDAEFEALATAHGTDDWRRWPAAVDRDLWSPPAALAEAAVRRRHALRGSLESQRHLFGQFLLAEQHQALRAAAQAVRPTPVVLFGDLQIGFSQRDVWSRRALFRRDYLMGAPPSRTNPAGQPWGYPVLDPAQYLAGDGVAAGPVLQLVVARVGRMLADFDGIRVDHPHGLVCPWVYDAADPEPDAAVARGARLFCSPGLADHPALARFAIPTADQLSADPGIARYADDWVRELRDDQIARYGVLFDAIMARVAAGGRNDADVVCEVLSTWPRPLRWVMERHGLGRFCVTQKADLTRSEDVYRSENAGPRDWIMVGNHDTAPIWALAQHWHGTAVETERAAHLAERLLPDATLRPRLAQWLTADPRHLCQGMFAELFAGRARRVSVFFADLFGLKDIYNRPGVVSPENWTLRLPASFADGYRTRVAEGGAFNVPLALALACVARRSPGDVALGAVARRLLAAARALAPALDGTVVSLIETALA
jgi:4-alpha-glucanotransferase